MNYEWEGARERGVPGVELLGCLGTMLAAAALYGAWLVAKLVGRAVAVLIGLILVML